MQPDPPDPALPASLLSMLARLVFSARGRTVDTNEPIGVLVGEEQLVLCVTREGWALAREGATGRAVPCFITEATARLFSIATPDARGGLVVDGVSHRVRLEWDGTRPIARAS